MVGRMIYATASPSSKSARDLIRFVRQWSTLPWLLVSAAVIRRASILALCAASAANAQNTQEAGNTQEQVGSRWTYSTSNARFQVEVVATGLRAPAGLSFLPDGRLLVADRPVGRLSAFDPAKRTLTPIDGVPPVHGKVDGGLMDVLVHPDYVRNGWIYLVLSIEVLGGNTTVVDRVHLVGNNLRDRQRLFTARPVKPNSNEFGSRLVLDHGYLYVTLGQRNLPENAQDLGSDLGKIIRLREDGTVPKDNPFVRRKGALPEIWTYGNRNPVGLAIDPVTAALWEHEHGPLGGDEINIIRRGRNYGWPVITYGLDYSGKLVGAGITHHPGMEQPVFYFNPDIAPSGMVFYTGTDFPRWRNNIFIGSLVIRYLSRIVVEGDHVIHEERLLLDRGWRIRAVQQAPDGSLYIGADGGFLARISAVK
jgi:glucose/arabinose dehydrogenase